MARQFAALILFTASAAFLFGACAYAADDRPIVGVLTLPNPVQEHFRGRSYFPASYVKWLESGGMRVVPIPYTSSDEDLDLLLPNLSGFLFTGGAAEFTEHGKLTELGRVGLRILDEVRSANAKGEHVPLWGTCLGFEFIMVLAAGPNPDVLKGGFDSENITLPLKFTPTALKSRMLSAAPKDIIDTLGNKPVTMNNHGMGVTPDDFYANKNLTDTFHLLSTNVDRKNREFTSTIEGKDLPIYATQWHPEKVQFEWRPDEVINHSQESVEANSYFARWIGAEVRKNTRSVKGESVLFDKLIYNYKLEYTYHVMTSFEQSYFFE